MKNLVYTIMLLLMASNYSCVSKKSKGKVQPMHIFILMGQSNMSGYGNMLPQNKKVVDGIYYIPQSEKNDFKWEGAKHPLHNRTKHDRFGLGLPFAKEYLKKHPGVKIGLIPVAWGGAGIDMLKKGTDVYTDAINKANFAIAHHGIIKAVLWHQGESDTVNKELAEQYESKLTQLIQDVRTDLKAPKLPFVVGNLAEFYGTGKDHCAPKRVSYINKVKNTLREIPKKVPNTAFVESTGGVTYDQNNVHFNRESYIMLGKRYEVKYESLVKE
ncbi:sialate O-acetylesterase [Halosquirtibacter laminarini]|uniref:Sialate O-acetylesterase n=1 Tax=Halosquirtibacter laminarini TaxID=3374600 RepID=A0AC61NFJ5_9BACT|nr:sialate O-acetylesterase [Prolixibacteraceae bacterium]